MSRNRDRAVGAAIAKASLIVVASWWCLPGCVHCESVSTVEVVVQPPVEIVLEVERLHVRSAATSDVDARPVPPREGSMSTTRTTRCSGIEKAWRRRRHSGSGERRPSSRSPSGTMPTTTARSIRVISWASRASRTSRVLGLTGRRG